MNTTILSIVTWILATPVAQLPQAHGASDTARVVVPSAQRLPPQVVYYDYIDATGILRGDRVIIDPVHETTTEVVGGEPPQGPWDVHILHDHGPVANRVNIAVVGDGYRADEMNTYAVHVHAFVEGFFNEPPLDDYDEYFNVYRVDVVSAESGVDEPDLDLYRDTALDMTFDCAGIPHLLCVDVAKALDAAALAPAADIVFAIANTPRYGGAGYATAQLATLAGASNAAVGLGLHEFGHAFAGLADEYFQAGTRYAGPEVAEPNATIFTGPGLAGQAHKWAVWLDLPQVDAFAGARYAETGLYRPTYTSKMRTLSAPFREVNGEQLILEIYSRVDLIDSHFPAEEVVSCAAVRAGGLAVSGPRPAHADFTMAWSVDGACHAEGPSTLSFAELNLPPGDHVVAVRVVDDTAQVRDEAARVARMQQVVKWSVVGCTPQPCATAQSCDDAREAFDN